MVAKTIADAKYPAFVRSYLGTCLWSSSDESDDQGGDPLDKNYSIDDFAPEAIDRAVTDCDAFCEVNRHWWRDTCLADDDHAGHDFWLTRNRHGCGYWDGDYDEWINGQNAGDVLTEASHAFGEISAVIGDDGQIYLEGG